LARWTAASLANSRRSAAFALAADHRYPIPTDRGFRFKPSPDAPNDVLRDLAAID